MFKRQQLQCFYTKVEMNLLPSIELHKNNLPTLREWSLPALQFWLVVWSTGGLNGVIMDHKLQYNNNTPHTHEKQLQPSWIHTQHQLGFGRVPGYHVSHTHSVTVLGHCPNT